MKIKNNNSLPALGVSQLLRLPCWFVYLFSIAVTLFTLWVRTQMLVTYEKRTLMLLFMLPIIISAYLGGLWAGLLSTATTAACVLYFIIPPALSFEIARSYDLIQFLVLLTSGVLISVLNESLHRSRRRAEEAGLARSEMEQALYASEEEYRDLVENSQTLICTHDLAGNFLSVNEAAVQLTGYSRETLLKTNVKQTFISSNVEGQFAAYIKAITSDGRAKGTMQVRLANGEMRIWAYENSLRSNGLAEPIVRGFAHDVTERVQAEKILKESEELSRHTLDTMLEGCQILDFSWHYLYLNPSAEIHNRRPNAELLGKVYMEMWPDIQDTQVFRVLNRCMVERIPGEMQNEFVFPDGTVRWFELAIHPIPEGIFILTVDITERKQAEEKLQESEKRYHLISENSADVIWTLDLATGRFTYVSPSVYALRNMTPEEVMAEPMQASITAESNQNISENLPERIKKYLSGDLSARTRTTEVDQVRKDGSIVPTEVVTNLITNAEGKVVEILGISRNITERKRAEELLRESEANLSSLIENTDGSIWAVDKQYGLIVGNREFHRNVSAVLGRRLEMGESVLLPSFPPQANAEWQGYYDRALQGEHFTNETQTRFQDTPHYIEYRFSPLREESGGIRGVTIFGRDVTERKMSEELLHENETRLRQALTAAKAGIWEWYLQTNQNIWSEELWKVYGLEPYSTVPSYDTWLATIHPDDREKAAQSVQDAARNETELNVEWRVVDKDGTQRWLMSRGQPLRNSDGQAVRFIGTVLDITERKQAEKQLLITLEELERSNSELEQFAYVASHDLQEPLRAVAGMVQLLQKRYHGQLDERADEYIDLAMDGSTRMQTLITDLLEYSRVDRRGNPIQPTDANEALRSALCNLHEAIQKGGAIITNGTLPTVEADATQLIQLFQNLISNAIKFCSKNPPKVHVAVEEMPDAWHFSVRDNGIGIEPQYFERIFLVFQRLHTRREYPGTGIGLSICKKIVDRHGGRIWVKSEPGQGTVFHFTIPRRS